MPTAHELVTAQFRKWELRGRGWAIFEQPVHPEPPFVPFPGYDLSQPPQPDDGRRPTILSSFVQKLSRQIATELPPPDVIPEPEEEPGPQVLIRGSLVELQVSLPVDLDFDRNACEQFLSTLVSCNEPVAFELLGTTGRVNVQFAASPQDALTLRRQLQAYFPEAVFQLSEGALARAWESCEGDETLVIECGLAREFLYMLAQGKLDPFIGLVGSLSELGEKDLGLFQVLFQSAQQPWAKSIVRSVTHADGKPFFVNQRELAGAAETKVSHPLYTAVVRIGAKADTFDRALSIASDVAGSLRVFSDPQGNELIPLKNDEYPIDEHVEDLLCRQSRRTGMLLNSDELIGFVHLPSSAVRSPVLQRDSGTTKAAPDSVRHSAGVLLGHNTHAGETVPVRLSADQRVRHSHIIGVSGTGKSTLLFNLIRQDIEKGDGVAVLDPHGDLIEQVLGIIPESRVEDVVLVDLSDTEYPIGFNILSAHSDIEKNLLASDLVSVFRRLSSSWGDQMDVVLQNAILAFLESAHGGTLADLRRFLIEPAFRAEHLKSVSDPELIYYWQKVFPQLTGNRSVGPVLTRLQGFMSQRPIRNMVSQPENRLDFAHIMDTGKIFLARLSEGLGGAENSYMLGTLLVSKFQQIAMSRQAQEHSARRDFWLYIDEFDHFITPTMAEILKGARKYRLGLTLAHQELHQLESDPKVASAVAAHPLTRVVFRVGDNDAKKLAESFSSFDAQRLKNLATFHAIARVERSDCDFNLTIEPPPKLDPSQAKLRREQVIAASREKYAKPRAEVEAALLASVRIDRTDAPAPKPQKSASPPGLSAKPDPPSVPKPKISEQQDPHPLMPSDLPPAMPAAPKPAPRQSEECSTPLMPTEPTPPRDLGRGGAQHQAIQHRVKLAAETLGFRSTIEKPVSGGIGSVDLFLERDGQTIACEISISTTIDHEVGNVAKCLKAGIQNVAVVCLEKDRLEKIKAAVSGSFGSEAASCVGYYEPDQFIAELERLSRQSAAPLEATRVRRGYKVKRSSPELDPKEQKQKEDIAIRSIAEAMRRR